MLILLATWVFFLLRENLYHTLYWKTGIPVLFVFWVTVILVATLGLRTEGGNLSAPVLMPFASYREAFNGGNKEIYRTNFMNALLFYPAGLLGCQILPGKWKQIWKAALITLVFALGSIAIEYTQYRLGLGLAETDDVLHNALGALLGAVVCGGFGEGYFTFAARDDVPPDET